MTSYALIEAKTGEQTESTSQLLLAMQPFLSMSLKDGD
jgi:hypothetical protein